MSLLSAVVHSLLCHPIGYTPELKAIPLRILMAVEW